MRPPSHQPRPHLPTALRSLNRRASSSLQWDPPTLIPCSPHRGSCRSLPLRRQGAEGRLHHQHLSAHPRQQPTRIRPRRRLRDLDHTKAIQRRRRHTAKNTATPVRHSRAPSVIPAPGPSFLRSVRHSCGGRNPCDHHRINHARTFRRPADPSIPALPPRCSGTPPPLPKRHTPSHLTTPRPLGLMPPTE